MVATFVESVAEQRCRQGVSTKNLQTVTGLHFLSNYKPSLLNFGTPRCGPILQLQNGLSSQAQGGLVISAIFRSLAIVTSLRS
jgi:hypothetical protein